MLPSRTCKGCLALDLEQCVLVQPILLQLAFEEALQLSDA